MKYTFWFECTDNGGGHQAFEVKAENKQEAIKKGMAFAKKHASGDICGDWECKMISEWTTGLTTKAISCKSRLTVPHIWFMQQMLL